MCKYLSLFLKAIIVIAAVWGISICAFDPNAFMGGKTVWLYFTIQSNIWMVLVALLGAAMMLRQSFPRWMSMLQLMKSMSEEGYGV